MIDDARRTSFDRNAAIYDAARPSYPDALIDRVLACARARDALEIGAGTGQATRLFARRGVAITAVEPGERLAALLRTNVASIAEAAVIVVESTFEAWPCDAATFDLVYAAQSIHWIDPSVRYAKIARVLRPGGHVAVIRNEPGAMEPALRAELDAAYAGRLPPRDGQAADSAEAARRFYADDIAASGLFGPVQVLDEAWTARYTTRTYLELLGTYSDHALLDDATRAALFAAIANLIDRRGGAIDVPYVAFAFVAAKR